MIKKAQFGTMLLLIASLFATTALAKEKVKIAVIEGLSGPFAANGEAVVRELKFAVQRFVDSENVETEVIALDGKTSPKQTLLQLKNAISQGAKYIVQGNSSAVAHSLISAIKKHNARNPDKRVLFLNHSAIDPAITERRCNFWHFRFDAHVGMKLQALIGAVAANKNNKTVYIIGQDYSYGKSIAAGSVAFLKAIRPDIKIVGNDLHPLGRIKDFTPYAKKIKQSNADAVITGNWGADMVRLVHALGNQGVKSKIYTFYGAGTGVSATIGKTGEGKVLVVTEGLTNPLQNEQRNYWEAFKKKYPDVDMLYWRIAMMSKMLGNAIKKTGSTKPIDVAKAIRAMKITRLDGQPAMMREHDHQILLGLYVLEHTSQLSNYNGVVNDFDKSGYGLKLLAYIPYKQTARPVRCKVEVPAK